MYTRCKAVNKLKYFIYLNLKKKKKLILSIAKQAVLRFVWDTLILLKLNFFY